MSVRFNVPLIYVCKFGNLERLKHLVSQGADVHFNDDAIFRIAAKYGQLKIMKYLVSQGADIHVKNEIALRYASANGCIKIVRYLVSQGADVNVNSLSDSESDSDSEDDHTDSPLKLASQNGHLQVVKYLVSECSADINQDSDIPLHVASLYGHLDVVQYLISQGANIRTINEYAMLSYRNPYIVAYLVSQGAPIFRSTTFQRQYISIYMKHNKPYKTRAASRIYFWWIPKCHEMSAPSGIRMAYRNLAKYESLCAS